jgi:very-short-patch-repair endonuclease
MESIKKQTIGGKKIQMGKYIADFCCPAEKIIVELDGQVHGDNAQIEKDTIRDQHIENLGFVILRFENKLVFEVPEMF